MAASGVAVLPQCNAGTTNAKAASRRTSSCAWSGCSPRRTWAFLLDHDEDTWHEQARAPINDTRSRGFLNYAHRAVADLAEAGVGRPTLAITRFARFLAEIGVEQVTEIDRSVLERYLAELRTVRGGAQNRGTV
ncbi:MAG: hypothetical protein ACRDQF_04925 [Thermocrispum sp.]